MIGVHRDRETDRITSDEKKCLILVHWILLSTGFHLQDRNGTKDDDGEFLLPKSWGWKQRAGAFELSYRPCTEFEDVDCLNFEDAEGFVDPDEHNLEDTDRLFVHLPQQRNQFVSSVIVSSVRKLAQTYIVLPLDDVRHVFQHPKSPRRKDLRRIVQTAVVKQLYEEVVERDEDMDSVIIKNLDIFMAIYSELVVS